MTPDEHPHAGPRRVRWRWVVLVVAAGAAVALLAPSPALTPVPASSLSAVRAARAGVAPLDHNPESVIVRAVDETNGLSVGDRRRLSRISHTPIATWLTAPASTSRRSAAAVVTGATLRRSTATLVLYRIPHRDCGSYSALPDTVGAEEYRTWVRSVVRGLGRAKAVVIVEPDALPQLNCLSTSEKQQRLELLRFATEAVRAQGSRAYLDAGHSGWVPPATMASRLRDAGIAKASGFSLNVAGFGSTKAEIAYGTSVSNALGGTRFVIDTSRNGAHVAHGLWCNPLAARLGRQPTWTTRHALVDAFLWVKTPGLSDGPCNGGPSAGTFWPKGALRLVGADT